MIAFKAQLGVWAGLVAATAVQWILGDGDLHVAGATGILILAVAVVKVSGVGFFFMELQQAPRMLRVIFSGYCALLFAVLVGLYLASGR